jgi:hypothetical protein
MLRCNELRLPPISARLVFSEILLNCMIQKSRTLNTSDLAGSLKFTACMSRIRDLSHDSVLLYRAQNAVGLS